MQSHLDNLEKDVELTDLVSKFNHLLLPEYKNDLLLSWNHPKVVVTKSAPFKDLLFSFDNVELVSELVLSPKYKVFRESCKNKQKSEDEKMEKTLNDAMDAIGSFDVNNPGKTAEKCNDFFKSLLSEVDDDNVSSMLKNVLGSFK